MLNLRKNTLNFVCDMQTFARQHKRKGRINMRERGLNSLRGSVINPQANVNSQDISVSRPLQHNVTSPLANESNLYFASEVDVRSGGDWKREKRVTFMKPTKC